MEATVWSGTGLLPEHLEIVSLTTIEDGRWQARCEYDAGGTRTLQFAAGDAAEAQVAGALRTQLGFSNYCADETARRLFEPFEMAADWPW
jgi:hypothetical protein